MLETIMKLIAEGKNFWLIAVSIIVVLIFNIKTFYDFLDSFSKRKLTILKDFVGEKGVTGSTKEVVQEELNSILFQYATGMKVDKRLREVIIDLHKSTNGKLTYVDFQRAHSFLRVRQDGTLGVREATLLDKGMYYYSHVASWLFWFMTALLVVILIFFPINDLRLQLAIFLYALLFFIFALFALSQTFPLSRARKIKDEIYKIRKQSFYPYTYEELKHNQISNAILSEAEKEVARKRFESHFGEIDIDSLIAADNEMIDADLAREYASNHQED